ncbi:MAG: GspH/FimT family pseudopilin [Planctomycetota bacterium]|jgi:prepilin-type N-terminal cleavage/methylation domain-containing protein
MASPFLTTRKPAGFTYIELVMVVLIIGILAAATVPSYHRSLSYHRVESAARRVQADLELARKRAMTSSTRQMVAFAVASDRYVLSGVDDLNHAAGAYEVRLSEPPYAVSLTAAEFAGAGDTDVEFNGFGVPDSGGTITMQSGTQHRSVVLDAETGKTSIQTPPAAN